MRTLDQAYHRQPSLQGQVESAIDYQPGLQGIAWLSLVSLQLFCILPLPSFFLSTFFFLFFFLLLCSFLIMKEVFLSFFFLLFFLFPLFDFFLFLSFTPFPVFPVFPVSPSLFLLFFVPNFLGPFLFVLPRHLLIRAPRSLPTFRASGSRVRSRTLTTSKSRIPWSD